MRELFGSTIERLLADTATPQVALAADGGVWPDALWAAVEQSGFALAAVPESAGGAGATWNDLYPVLLACGRHPTPVPLPEAILANWLLGSAGIEPVVGPLSFASTPVGSLNDVILRDVPWGRHVDHVVAITAGSAPRVLLLATGGLERRERLDIAGEPRDDLLLRAARVVAEAPLPADMTTGTLLLGGALLRSVQIAGALQAVLDMTTRYAGERVQFGKPIGNFQAIQHQIAVLAEHTALTSVAAEAACAESDDGLAHTHIAAAKVCSAEAAGIVAGIAHAVHGAIGFTHEHVLHLFTRRLWAWRCEFGSLTTWSQHLGRAACATGSAGYWPAVTRGAFEASREGSFQ